MSAPRTLHVEKTASGVWTRLQRSPGRLPETPLFQLLNWILEQLNFGNFESEEGENGDVVTLIIGKGGARPFESLDKAAEAAQRRLLAVDISGVLAGCRESGITPKHAYISKLATQRASGWFLRNTEFHYAFELTKVLARLNKKTFKLEAPPIAGLAPPSVVSYLKESTRCWLYGFHGACVSLCRACLEETLKAATPIPILNASQLDLLIDEARQKQVLDDCLAEVAHSIRKKANKFLHGHAIAEEESRETLDNIRSVVEQVFSPDSAA